MHPMGRAEPLATDIVQPSLIDGRYEVLAMLGRGGMATVYSVRDQKTGKRLALKKLAEPERSRAAFLTSQFEREYHTLRDLAHPCVVEAYDYGIDVNGAYYTMELLEGTDLRDCGRLPWRTACALLRDVASALAVLHSRRLIHRDLSPRNVRCTTDGRAKLIDFGAMMPMRATKTVVGTPPFVPPEAFHLQALDARADLYSLGALSYFVLTGRHAYPARNLSMLIELWTQPVPPARTFVPELPQALDDLVASLLSRDRDARPMAAAEVMERLSGIAGLPLTEHSEVTRSYLVSPTLVGREEPLAAVRTKLSAAIGGRGVSVVVSGAPGTGRSRFLDACVLEAKLLGMVVLSAGGAEARRDYGVVGALAAELLHAAPDLEAGGARAQFSILKHVVEELGETKKPDDSRSHERLHAVLCDALLSLARSKAIAIAIDDVETVDEPSAAFLARIAGGLARRRLALVATTNREATESAAATLLRQVSRVIDLDPLRGAETEALLRSVFGDMERVKLLAERVHALSAGAPRWTMALAEHLVERGVARYEAGSWSLPSEPSSGDLPETLSAALGSRLDRLSSDARELGEALALTDVSLVPVEAYAGLTSHGDPGRTYRALDALVTAGVLVPALDRYKASQRELFDLLSAGISSERRRALHARIARALEGAEAPFLLPHHLMLAGEERAAVERLLVLHGSPRMEYSTRVLSLLEQAAASAARLDFDMRVRLELELWAANFAGVLGDYERFAKYGERLLERFEKDSGLADYREIGDETPPQARLFEALARARTRYEATPESERGLPPADAIRSLARLCSTHVNMASLAQNLELLERLPSLEPFAALSPALGTIQLLVDGMKDFQSGRYVRVREKYARLIERLEEPDHAGLEPVLHESMLLGVRYLMGVVASTWGLPDAPEWVATLERVPGHRVNAWRVHMTSELMQGDVEAARDCERRAELLALQDGGQLRYRGSTARMELLAHAFSDDLIGVKRAMERCKAVADLYPRWGVDFHLARFHYRRLQGDAAAALEMLAPALEAVAPGRHIDWALVTSAHVMALNGLGRHEEAARRGLEYLAICEREDLTGTTRHLMRQVAESLAKVGRFDEALRLADECVREAEALGIKGLILGGCYETRARIALAMDDRQAFRRFADLCAVEYKRGKNPALVTKCERLFREGCGAEGAMGFSQGPDGDVTNLSGTHVASGVSQRLAACRGPGERAAAVLELLLEGTGASAGLLVAVKDGEVSVLAETEASEPSRELLPAMGEYLLGEGGVTVSGDADATLLTSQWTDASGRSFEPLLIAGGRDGENVVAALAALHYGVERMTPPVTLLRVLADALLECDDVDLVTRVE